MKRNSQRYYKFSNQKDADLGRPKARWKGGMKLRRSRRQGLTLDVEEKKGLKEVRIF
jgi:hypothetical protein